MGLKEYNKKRNFKSTKEPKGNIKKDNNYHITNSS